MEDGLLAGIPNLAEAGVSIAMTIRQFEKDQIWPSQTSKFNIRGTIGTDGNISVLLSGH